MTERSKCSGCGVQLTKDNDAVMAGGPPLCISCENICQNVDKAVERYHKIMKDARDHIAIEGGPVN